MLEEKKTEKQFVAVEVSLLNRLIEVVSNLPYKSVDLLMEEIKRSQFIPVNEK